MEKSMIITRELLGSYFHLRNIDTSQSASEDYYIKSNEDTSYTVLQPHPIYPDLVLAVKQSSLEFYNTGTMTRAEGIATEDLYTFQISHATFLSGGMDMGSKGVVGGSNVIDNNNTNNNVNPSIGLHELVVLFTCDRKKNEKAIFAYSITARSIISRFIGHEEPITTLVASPAPNTSIFLSGSFEGRVILWGPDTEKNTFKVLAKYQVPESEAGPVCAFDWSGRIFVICSGMRMFFFSVENPTAPFKKLELTVRSRDMRCIVDVCVSPHGNGDMTAVRMNTGEVVILDSMESYTVIGIVNDSNIKYLGKGGMSFSSDGLTLLLPAKKIYAVILNDLIAEKKREALKVIEPILIPIKPESGESCDDVRVITRFIPGSACIITAGDTIGVYQYRG